MLGATRLIPLAFLVFAVKLGTAQQDALDEVTAAFQRGDLPEAERQVAAVLKQHTENVRALVLMGVILDAERRYNDADNYYTQALRLTPRSAPVLNNIANHYFSLGDLKKAREFYRKALVIDPRHRNANLQLAQLSVDEGRGVDALKYLNALPEDGPSNLDTSILRSRALALSGRCTEASEILKFIQEQPGADSRRNFSIGLVLAECKRYEKAEEWFSRALDAEPRSFDILYNLAFAALRAGHLERALREFDVALKERPDDADCLYAFAQALLKAERPLDAAALLAKAEKIAPAQPDVPLLLAQAMSQLEFFGDAAAAYERYLALRPNDETARRERGSAYAQARESKKALADLDWYVQRHPQDAVGFYELAIAQQAEPGGKARHSLDRALALDPKLIEARYARAVLSIAANHPAEAIEDLRPVMAQTPENVAVLARLAQAYLDLHQPQQADEVLQRALKLKPDARFVLVQYRRALIDLGKTQEAAAISSQLAQQTTPANAWRPQSGLVEFLRLSASDQRTKYIANLRKAVAADPNNVELAMQLGNALTTDGKIADALQIYRGARNAADAKQLANAGRILLDAGELITAQEFLEVAIVAHPSLSAARLDLAATLFRLQGPEAALRELAKTPLDDRKGDYYLLRAQLLDASGNVQEAVNALNSGLRFAPTRASLYLESAGFLLKHQMFKEALALLAQASRILPDNRELLLSQAVTLSVLRRDDDAQKLLTKIQATWPEWDRPYLLNGIILEIQLKSSQALPLLETAIALGAATPDAYYYEALAITHATPEALDNAARAIGQALRLTAKDPYIFLLAGKISFDQKRYSVAIEQLQKATELLPTLIPAHYALRHAYQALGDEAKAATEMTAIKRIASETAASEKSPFPVEDFLFSVRPPS